MCQLSVRIEDHLHAAGYKTERIGDIVNAHDPVHQSLPGSTLLFVSHFNLVEIRSMEDAWGFTDARS